MSTNSVPNVGSDLVRIHKVITRALAVSIQNSLPGAVAEAHQAGFAAYVRALTILLHSHHAGEDELAFPFWQAHLPIGSFDQLRGHHRQMAVFLSQLESWLAKGALAWHANALDELQQVFLGLQALWQTHIALEEAAIGPENSSKYLTPEENLQLGKQLTEHGQAHSQPNALVMPFVIFNLAGEDRAVFMKLLPSIMLQQLIPQVWKETWAPMMPFLLPE
jgi:hypothetical protein